MFVRWFQVSLISFEITDDEVAFSARRGSDLARSFAALGDTPAGGALRSAASPLLLGPGAVTRYDSRDSARDRAPPCSDEAGGGGGVGSGVGSGGIGAGVTGAAALAAASSAFAAAASGRGGGRGGRDTSLDGLLLGGGRATDLGGYAPTSPAGSDEFFTPPDVSHH